MAIGQMELALRVAAGLFVIVVPTLLFLGLWNGLMRLRDDDLIERVRHMGDHVDTSPPTSGVSWSTVSDIDESEVVVCDGCGTSNLAGMTYCRECLGTLSED